MTDKNEFVEKLKTQIDEWNSEIKKMEAHADKAKADGKVKYEESLQKLREQRDEAQKKLQELQQSSDAAWDDMRRGAEKMWANVEEAFRKAWSRFR